MWLRPILLLLAIAYAASAPGRGPLRLYLDMQFLYTILVYGTLLFVPETTFLYAFVFSLATTALLILALWVAWRAARAHKARGMAILLAGCFAVAAGGRAATGITALRLPHWIGIGEGACLMFAGTLLGLSIPFHPTPAKCLYAALTGMWLVQAAYEFGFVLHLPLPAWLDLNEWLPCYIVAGAMLIIGRERRHAQGVVKDAS